MLRTSAALAAADFGSLDSGAFPPPNVRPPDDELIFGGTAARPSPVFGGAFAGAALSVRPSPLKLPLSDPQQLPMLRQMN